MKKVNYRNLSSQVSIILLVLTLTISNVTIGQENADAVAGESLFKSNCAACHKLDKRGVGPALRNIDEKYDREWLYKWIKNSQGLIKSGDSKAVALFKEYNNSVMTSFPALSNKDIDNILAYTSLPKPEPKVIQKSAAISNNDTDINENLILGGLVLILFLLSGMFYLVRKSLTKLSQANAVEVEPESRKPLWKVFVQNQFLMLVSAIMFLLVSAYFMYGFFMQLGVDQGYAPVQPIHYSHKIHAGANKIDCNYCHSSARSSKTAAVPSANVCMNCHTEIKTGTNTGETEIQKIYDAVGFNPETGKYIEDYQQKPIEWIRVHSLPDLTYFNHSQHVTVAGLECQQCHGPMEEKTVGQVAYHDELNKVQKNKDEGIKFKHPTLTMGWCIDCHRTKEIDMESNEYYADMHEKLKSDPKYKNKKITPALIGGMECGKCHY